MNTSPPLLDLRDVGKTYAAGAIPLAVLAEVNLQVGAGDSIAIVGPSGSGKSTLLNLMGVLDRPTRGAVLFEGRDTAGLNDDGLARLRNERIGFVFQNHHLLPQCTVWENVLIPTLAGPRPPAPDTRSLAERLLQRVGLQDRLAHQPGELSGGECQRVAVVRALINRPQLLLADEPTGSLDGQTAADLADMLADLNREESVALVVVTHSRDLASRMRREFRLRQGRVEPARESHA